MTDSPLITHYETLMSELEEVKTFLSGKLRFIGHPYKVAPRYRLEKPAHVVIWERSEGILIRRLET